MSETLQEPEAELAILKEPEAEPCDAQTNAETFSEKNQEMNEETNDKSSRPRWPQWRMRIPDCLESPFDDVLTQFEQVASVAADPSDVDHDPISQFETLPPVDSFVRFPGC